MFVPVNPSLCSDEPSSLVIVEDEEVPELIDSDLQELVDSD